jgi:poly(A) polymerase
VQASIIERAQHPISRRDIDPNVLKILYRLINAGHIAYLVGGSVRDLMMGRRPKDFDVGTSAHPHEVHALFRNSRLIGRRFRLVHVFFGPKNIEVATFRQRAEDTVETDDPMIRHDNTFGTPEEDAFRRDFTVNSLFYDPRTFHVIDYAGGVSDLRARLIRSIGDAGVRMREDPVRMIRAVRFAAKLGFEIEAQTRAAIEQHYADLAKASQPRLIEETFRTLSLKHAECALVLLERLGMLPMLLPELSRHLKANADALEEAPTARNLAAMGAAIGQGLEPSRGFILACLFADLYLRSELSGRANLVYSLRTRGFSRADTEQMRLLLDALGHMIAPSRITRRIVRRPYFPQARLLFDLLAPVMGADAVALDRFLATPPEHAGRSGRRPRYRGTVLQAGGAASENGSPNPPRRRRRRRGGRGRNRGAARRVEHGVAIAADVAIPAPEPIATVEPEPRTSSEVPGDDSSGRKD